MIGDALGGVGVGLGAGSGGHGSEASRGGEQSGQRFLQSAGDVQVFLFKHDRRAGFEHGLGIALLVVVGGGGKGDKQAGLSGGGQFGYRGGSAAGQDQVGLGKTAGMSSRKGSTRQRAGSAPVAA